MHFSLPIMRMIKEIRMMLCIFDYLMSSRPFYGCDSDFHTDRQTSSLEILHHVHDAVIKFWVKVNVLDSVEDI